MAVDSWVAAPSEDKAITFRVAEGIRFIEYGTNSIFRILQGTVAIIFGIAIVKSKLLNKWIGGAGVVIGAITIYAGIEVAYLAFGYANIGGLRGISMIIYFIWVGILGGLMWKKSMSRSPLMKQLKPHSICLNLMALQSFIVSPLKQLVSKQFRACHHHLLPK